MGEERGTAGGEGAGLSRKARRWWTIGGGALLAAMVLVAIFSLGVYVGRQEWGTVVPASERAPRPVLPAQQPAAPPVWPQARPALEGVICGVEAEGILVASPQGARFVRTTPETRFFRLTDQGEVEIRREALRPGAPVSTTPEDFTHLFTLMGREALRPGVPVSIFGRIAPDGRTLTADRIVLLPQR